MQTTPKRTSRACERCRQTRRRCEPPYPCKQCKVAGATCAVRMKPRPNRKHRAAAVTFQRNDHKHGTGHCASPLKETNCSSGPAAPKGQADIFDQVRGLVQVVLMQRYGYVLDCALEEPPLSISLPAPDDLQISSLLNDAKILELLTAFQKFLGWQDVNLVDIEDLHATICADIEMLQHLSPPSVSIFVARTCLPLDQVALLFVCLALGAVAIEELGRGRFYFSISTELVKHFVGQPTLQLCVALFLQHQFALRTETSNFTQGIIVQAIQIAHDLGLQHNNQGIRGLQLYFLIYMADQYSSLTYNTKPAIRASKLPMQIFKPLGDSQPRIQTLVDLVTLNGFVIEQSHQYPSPERMIELETAIGSLSAKRPRSMGRNMSCGEFRMTYEPIAWIHMLSCRVKLRAPGLSDPVSWLPALCICIHAAKEILSIYFQLYRPVLETLVGRYDSSYPGSEKCATPAASKMPTTWRQVRRIMYSVFLVMLSYWYGETYLEEASKAIAMARLLLEYPRWRWGEKLNEPIQALVDMSQLCGIDLYEYTQKLLPGASGKVLNSPGGIQQVQTTSETILTGGSENNGGAFFDPVPVFDERPGMFGSTDCQFSFFFDTYQDRYLFGLWEPFDIPTGSDAFPTM